MKAALESNQAVSIFFSRPATQASSQYNEPVLTHISDTQVVSGLEEAIDAFVEATAEFGDNIYRDVAGFRKYSERLAASLEMAANEGWSANNPDLADGMASLREALKETSDRGAVLGLAIQVCDLAGLSG
jgi:hypothetical protein